MTVPTLKELTKQQRNKTYTEITTTQSKNGR